MSVHLDGEAAAHGQGTSQLPVGVHVDSLAARAGLDRLGGVGEPGVVRVGDNRVGVGGARRGEDAQQNRQEHESACSVFLSHDSIRFLSSARNGAVKAYCMNNTLWIP